METDAKLTEAELKQVGTALEEVQLAQIHATPNVVTAFLQPTTKTATMVQMEALTGVKMTVPSEKAGAVQAAAYHKPLLVTLSEATARKQSVLKTVTMEGLGLAVAVMLAVTLNHTMNVLEEISQLLTLVKLTEVTGFAMELKLVMMQMSLTMMGAVVIAKQQKLAFYAPVAL